MDFIVRFLATLFAKFKIKNPVVAAVVLTLLASAVATVQNGALYGLFPVPEWAETAITYMGLFLTAVSGSQTYQYLEGNTEAK